MWTLIRLLTTLASGMMAAIGIALVDARPPLIPPVYNYLMIVLGGLGLLASFHLPEYLEERKRIAREEKEEQERERLRALLPPRPRTASNSSGGGFRDHYPEATGEMGSGSSYNPSRVGYDSDN